MGSAGLGAVLSGDFSVSKTAPVGVGALMHAGASDSVVGEETARIRSALRRRKGGFGVKEGEKIGGEKTLSLPPLSSSSGERSETGGPSGARQREPAGSAAGQVAFGAAGFRPLPE